MYMAIKRHSRRRRFLRRSRKGGSAVYNFLFPNSEEKLYYKLKGEIEDYLDNFYASHSKARASSLKSFDSRFGHFFLKDHVIEMNDSYIKNQNGENPFNENFIKQQKKGIKNGVYIFDPTCFDEPKSEEYSKKIAKQLINMFDWGNPKNEKKKFFEEAIEDFKMLKFLLLSNGEDETKIHDSDLFTKVFPIEQEPQNKLLVPKKNFKKHWPPKSPR